MGQNVCKDFLKQVMKRLYWSESKLVAEMNFTQIPLERFQVGGKI